MQYPQSVRPTWMLRRVLLPAFLSSATILTGALAVPSSATAAPSRPESRSEIVAELGRAASTPAQLQRQVDLQLKLAPGGRQTAANEVSYAGRRFVVTFAEPGAVKLAAAADCPSGWFCFYDNVNFGYPRGKLSSPDWQDLSWWGWQDRTESTHNNTGKNVTYLGHYDAGNTGNGHRLDVPFWVDAPYSARASVSPRNAADHVNRAY